MSFEQMVFPQSGHRRSHNFPILRLRGFCRAGARVIAAFLMLLSATANVRPVKAQSVQFLPSTTILAGNGTKSYTGDKGPATSAGFGSTPTYVPPEAAVMDPAGNIYIADTGNNVIRRVDAATGIITTFAGTATNICATGTPGDTYGNGCPATQAILHAPLSVRYYKGDIYIADTNGNEVRKVDGATGIISVFAGNGSAALATAGLATNIAVIAPQDLVFDASGNAFICTGGGKPLILKVDPTGMATIVAGTGVAGNTGDGGPATAAQIQSPTGLAIDPQGNIYFSGTIPNNVREINVSTKTINTVVASSGVSTGGFAGDGGPANLALLHTPQHIAIDALGNLYIADQANSRIRMVTPPAAGAAYGTITTIAGNATAGNAASGVGSVNASINQPRSVDVTASGDLIISDGFNAEIKLIAPPVNLPSLAIGATETFNALARVITPLTLGSYAVAPGYPSFTGTTNNCTAGASIAANTICTVPVTFSPVAGGLQTAPLVLTDSNGNKYLSPLAGLGNAPAAAVLPGLVGAVAGTGAAGNSGDNGAPTSAQLHTPLAIVVDGMGNYYFADSANNEVREISAATGMITRVAGTGTAGFSGDGAAATAAMLNTPSGLAIDGAGNLYIADTGNNRIRKVTAGVISTFAGTGVAGLLGDGGPAASAQLSGPQGLFLTPAGVLYVADTGNHAIRIIGLRSTGINTIAGNGTAGSSGDTQQASLALLSSPQGVAVDNNAVVYIADTGNHKVRRIAGGIITTLAGGGASGFSDGAAATALFSSPTALAVDAAANVYVTDTGNNVVRRIANGQVATVAGTGTGGASGNGSNSTSATFNAPQGVGLDGSGNILIADTGNNLIRNVNVAATKLAFPTTSPNTTSTAQTVTLSNAGNLPLTVASVTVPAGFSEQASGSTDCNTTGLSLASGATCQTSLVFMPTAVQTYSGTAVLTDTAQSQAAAAQTIAVSGMGAYVFTAAISAASPVTAGTNQSITVSVTNPNAVYTGTIHFTSSDPKAVLPADTTFTAADNGRHTFTGVQFRTAGMEAITVTDTVTASITATSVVTVVGGPAAALTILMGNQQSANINSVYRLPLQVMATDSLGNPSAGASVTFTAPSTNADASFTGGSSTFTGVTNSLGQLTTTTLTADGVTGTFTVSAITAGAPAVSFNLTNTSTVAAGFNLASNPANIVSLPPGTSASVVVTITPVGGFNSPVTVACTGAVATTNCNLSTTTVAPSGNGNPTTFTLTVTTTGPAQAAVRETHTIFYASLLLLFLGSTLRKRKRLQGLVLAGVCCLALGSLSGCGSGSGTHTGETLPGVYSLTVTGTSGSLSKAIVINYYVAGTP